ncbi:MFS transporter [Nitrospirillum viridazoti]|uniref:MFS transporter n=1 Tax=Nitrospirillum viridazoti TaxID=3144925 RepID=UPI000AD913DF|nr:MFS transporter [Nitrospirillum amazonense]TWB27960.1 putative MFS family arabinose efflux permease [Nitrospirillum amazonense]
MVDRAIDAPTQGAQRKAGLGQGIILVISGFLPILAIISLAPAVPTILDHFHDVANASLLVPVLVSAPGLAIAVLAPFAGLAVDRFGRRPLLVWSTLLYGIAGALPYFLDSLYSVIASRLLLGVTEAAILTIVNTLIADYYDPAGRRKWLVIQGVTGSALAPAVIAASGLLTELRWNGVFLIYLIALPIFAGMYALIFEPGKSTTADSSAGGRTPAFPLQAVALYGAVTLLASTIYYVFIIQGGLVFREVGIDSPSRVGTLISVASIGVPIGTLLFGYLGKRTTALQLAGVFALLGVGLTGVGLSSDYKIMVALLLLQQMGAGLTVPSLIAWAQGVLPFAHRGRGMGIWASCFFLGQFTSPFFVAGARALTNGTVQAAFVTMGLVALAAGIVALTALLKAKPSPADVLP